MSNINKDDWNNYHREEQIVNKELHRDIIFHKIEETIE